jgi:hypothetical protein
MPSPFPGMDPYLEDEAGWRTFNPRFITVLDEILSASVGPRFIVAQRNEVYLIEPDGGRRDRPILPDVSVVDGADPPWAATVGGAITAPARVLARYPEQLEQRYIEILAVDDQSVIAVIDLLSPTNKNGGGAIAFDRKRRRVMASPAHWIEIDLLRTGLRFPPATGRGDYCAVLKRGDHAEAGEETEFLIWDADVRDRLPTIAVPLTPDAPVAPLDLQAALDTVYGRFYEGRVNYGRPAVPPLAPADAAWAAELIRAARLGR